MRGTSWRNAQTAIQLPKVYVCVRGISETIASLPLGVYEARVGGNQKATKRPLYRLIHDESNSAMTTFVLREFILAHLLLRETVITRSSEQAERLYAGDGSELSVQNEHLTKFHHGVGR